MSLFKKPNRNFRRREVDVQDDDNEAKETEVIKPKARNVEKNGNSGTKLIKQTLLSFGEELNEADDGEVFKVRKSSHSKKIRRQIDKEKEERKKKGSPKIDATSDDKVKEKNQIIATEEVTIKIKNPIAGPVTAPDKILSGTSAEMAGYRSSSDEDEENERSLDLHHHKFSQPDHVKMVLKSGRIPDAALIHAARKRRQQAREMGTANYIPIEEENNTKVDSGSKSRLVREDDNDGSDEDEIITMSGIVSFAADREKRKEGLDTFITTDAEDENVDDDEWETQQIRKAVTGAQLAAAQQESYYQYMMNNVGTTSVSSVPEVTQNTGPVNSGFPTSESNVAFLSLSAISNLEIGEPEEIAKKLQERLEKLEEVHSRRNFDLKNMTEEMNTLATDLAQCKAMVPALANRFQFYQDLRGYVTDLVECLDEKIPLIVSLEQRLITMYQKKATELINRRRQDVKDQMEELTPAKNLPGVKPDEERIRRAAEREGRRYRRSKKRSLVSMKSHTDGMSTDDELPDMAVTNYRNQQEIIESDARHVFEDVVDEFIAVDEILKRFADWRKTDKTAYIEAYANMCLPKILGPIIRMNMLMWNPLLKEDDIHIEKLSWLPSVLVYSAERTETEESLRKDPDLQLLPNLIDKVVIPKLDQIVKAQWDPVSERESHRLSILVQNIMSYPFIAPKSKLFTQLMNTIIDKMKLAVENDAFIPILPKQLYDAGKSNVFFQRQFTQCVKLLRNILKWHGIINEEILTDIANSSLLNRYLLMSIRTLQPLEAASKCQMVASSLPDTWLKENPEIDLHLTQFFGYIKHVITSLDFSNPHGREAVEKLNNIIQNTR